MFVRHLLVLLTGALIVPVAAAPAPPARIDLVARIYNTARVPDGVRDAALSAATRALVGGAFNVAWRNCDTAQACNVVPTSGELVIRLVRASGPSSNSVPLVLGEASIDRSVGAGVLATIYVNRVEMMAELSETDTALLLGRAIAHEVGHLLLATNAHSPSGLMRAQWSPGEIHGNHFADWVLTKEDVAAIQRRLR